jgi:hypothetical protein
MSAMAAPAVAVMLVKIMSHGLGAGACGSPERSSHSGTVAPAGAS